MFAPTEVIFAPTSRCNLFCAHCRVRRGPEELEPGAAVRFLEGCAEAGVERVGFSGGEPFLRPDFLEAVIRAAVEKGLLFDRLMTNGTWARDGAELRSTLGRIFDAGFDGRVGLSWDLWHGQGAGEAAAFVRACHEASGRRDSVELAWSRSKGDGDLAARFRVLADALGGALTLEGGEPAAIVDAPGAGPGPDAADGEALSVPIVLTPYSAGADEDAWGGAEWFVDDFCEGPGQVLYVHPDGSVAPCCGFANENPELILGRMEEGATALIARAAEKPRVATCYGKGLGRQREEMEAAGFRFPGKTADQCFFCDWLCARERG